MRRARTMRPALWIVACCTLVDALQLHHHKTVRRRDVSQKALRLDQPLLRIGNKVTNWVPAVGAVAGATVVGAAAVVAGRRGLGLGRRHAERHAALPALLWLPGALGVLLLRAASAAVAGGCTAYGEDARRVEAVRARA